MIPVCLKCGQSDRDIACHICTLSPPNHIASSSKKAIQGYAYPKPTAAELAEEVDRLRRENESLRRVNADMLDRIRQSIKVAEYHTEQYNQLAEDIQDEKRALAALQRVVEGLVENLYGHVN